MQSDGTNSYTYDENGNMLTRQTTNFTWDYENRLTGVTGTSSYSYDYLGRRKSKTVGSVTTTYLYDGQNLIYELSGSTPADYLFGPGIDEPLAMRRSAQVYYYSTDGLGSVGIVSDSAGAVKNKYSYDAWGVIKSQTATISNPFTYTARETAEAGLMFYRARYYQMGIGRFVSEDPVRQQGGINFYTYVLNSPSMNIDPPGTTTYTNCGGKGAALLKQVVLAMKTSSSAAANTSTKDCLKCHRDHLTRLDNVDIECIWSKKSGNPSACAFVYPEDQPNKIYLSFTVIRNAVNGAGARVPLEGATGGICPCLPSILLHETEHLLGGDPDKDNSVEKCADCDVYLNVPVD